MSDTLLIRLNSDAGIRDWLILDEFGQTPAGVQTGPLPDVGHRPRKVIVVVPAEDIRLMEAVVPGRNRQKVLQAVPYVLEEQLAQDVDALHFSVGQMQDDNRYPVAIVDRKQMDVWFEMLRENHLKPELMITETQAIPLHEDAWSLLIEDDRAIIRSGEYAGSVTDTNNVMMFFELYAGREDAPEQVRVYGNTVVDLGIIDAVMDESDEQTVLPLLSKGLETTRSINLLQGQYSQKENIRALLTPWKATAALLLAGLLTGLVSMGVEYSKLSKRQASMTVMMEQLYRDAFPDAKRIVNPRSQMEQKLTAMRRQAGTSHTSFMMLIGEMGEVLRNTPGVTINGASFRDGRLDLELMADNLQLLDTLKQSLMESGQLKAEILSATTEAGQKSKAVSA